MRAGFGNLNECCFYWSIFNKNRKQNHFVSSYNVSGKCYTEDLKFNSFDNLARKGLVSLPIL